MRHSTRDEPFVAQYVHAVRPVRGGFAVQGADDGCFAPREPVQNSPDSGHAGRVKTHKRVVQQEQFRLHGQDLGQGHEMLLPVAEQKRGPLGQGSQVQFIQDLHAQDPALFFGQLAVA